VLRDDVDYIAHLFEIDHVVVNPEVFREADGLNSGYVFDAYRFYLHLLLFYKDTAISAE
jgi:hypothetical protein